MTDEESGDEGFLITRSPSWRHARLTRLFHKLDKKYKKYSKSGKSRPLKPRKPGPFSERTQPITAPKWAVADDIYVGSNESSAVCESPEETFQNESSFSSDSTHGSAETAATNPADPTVSVYIHIYHTGLFCFSLIS